jgi:hypothetical protein
MSVAVIGGLFTSTLLTLFVIPVIYLIFDDIKDWVIGRVRRYNAYRRLREMTYHRRRVMPAPAGASAAVMPDGISNAGTAAAGASAAKR